MRGILPLAAASFPMRCILRRIAEQAKRIAHHEQRRALVQDHGGADLQVEDRGRDEKNNPLTNIPDGEEGNSRAYNTKRPRQAPPAEGVFAFFRMATSRERYCTTVSF